MLGPVAVGPGGTFVVSDEKNNVVAVDGAVGINPIDVETLVTALSVYTTDVWVVVLGTRLANSYTIGTPDGLRNTVPSTPGSCDALRFAKVSPSLLKELSGSSADFGNSNVVSWSDIW